MRLCFWIGAAICCVSLGSAATAVEPYLEFVRRLREAKYYDLVETYLQQIEQAPSTPPDVRSLIPYERGVTLLESSRLLRNPEARSRQLDEAQALLERFVRESPNHQLAGQANTERARILLNKAMVEVWQADAPANQGNQDVFRQRARGLIAQARSVFQQAHDQHKAAWQKLKGFIPEEEKVKRAQRAEVEGVYMQAQVDLARCVYEEAQTYERDSDKRRELLNKAAAEFEAIHQRYRSQVAGLHARLWQGKCFEEQGDIRKALGIYNEILEHPGEQLRDLQDRARWFRLICLNDDSRKDYQLVIDEATAWRKDASERLRTPVGLGIQYELARAQEALVSSNRTLTDILKTETLKQALANAQTVARYPGALKAPAVTLAQRLSVSLNREVGDPRDFDTAMAAADQKLEESKKLTSEIAAAEAAGERNKLDSLNKSLHATAGEMIRLYDLALKLATPRTDVEQLNMARFRLAFAYFLERKNWEAAVVADYLARNYRDEFPEVAVESAYLALAAFDRIFSEADETDRDFEMQQVMRTALFIAEAWPESDRAIDARTAVARTLRQSDQPEKAAEFYAQVPSSSKQFAEAQLNAGQSYWNAYLTRSAQPEDQRPAADVLASWREKAEQHLRTGIQRRTAQLPESAATPDDLVLAKLSLVQILNREGRYTREGDQPGALELLTESPHAVIDAVTVPEGQPRPTNPGDVKSLPIASLAYQQLLRTQIGLHDLDGARRTRERLEAIVSEGGSAGVLTQVYVEFGRELQKELQQLQDAGDTERLNDVRSAFEAFLADLFNRKDGQTFTSLLWIAETYAGLAEGSAHDQAQAQVYFDKAASMYADIVRAAQSDPHFLSSVDQLLSVKLRLVNCRRAEGNYAAAEKTLREVLQERPNALDAQIEAARLYEEWAEKSGDAQEKLRIAIYGQSGEPAIWGWAVVAQKLQRAAEIEPSSSNYREQYVDACYHLASCEVELADEQTSNEKMREHLNAAKLRIHRFIAITAELSPTDWQRFDNLYARILRELGEPIVKLERRAEGTAAAANSAVKPAAMPGATTPVAAAAPVQDAQPAQSSNLLAIALLCLLGLGTATAVYLMTVRQDQKRRNKYRRMLGTPEAGGQNVPSATRTPRKF